jgi:NAD(P)H-dependent FMN reductase
MPGITVLALVGSLRTASINRQLAGLAAQSAPDGVTVVVYDGLGDLPFYNEDIDTADAPAAVSALRAAAAGADAALVVTPEYNGSIPGVLKNAIDWLSRPWGDSALKDKPLAVIGTALGRYGGAWAHDETRKSFGIAGARVVESISLSLPAGPLDGKHPREDAAVVAAVREALATLVAEVG